MRVEIVKTHLSLKEKYVSYWCMWLENFRDNVYVQATMLETFSKLLETQINIAVSGYKREVVSCLEDRDDIGTTRSTTTTPTTTTMPKSKTMTVIWITRKEYVEDIVPENAHAIPHDFYIQWSGQRNGNKDHHVGRGTFVFYRDFVETPFIYMGRVKAIRTLRQAIPKEVVGLYKLKIQPTKSSGRVFPLLANETGSGCYKRSVLKTLGWTSDRKFHMEGISIHEPAGI